jgi:hypothetical protein
LKKKKKRTARPPGSFQRSVRGRSAAGDTAALDTTNPVEENHHDRPFHPFYDHG